jgi:hypothetical protein
MANRTEKEVLLYQTAEWFKNSPWSVEAFAHDALAPALAAAGLIEPLGVPDDGAEYLRDRKAWGQQISRIFHGTKPFPLEWKWVWINKVAEPYRTRILTECQALAGCMNVKLPEIRTVDGVLSARARIGAVMIEVGEFFTAAAEPSGDGQYDREDCQVAAKEMLTKGVEAIQAILAELHAVAAGTGVDLPALALSPLAAFAGGAGRD